MILADPEGDQIFRFVSRAYAVPEPRGRGAGSNAQARARPDEPNAPDAWDTTGRRASHPTRRLAVLRARCPLSATSPPSKPKRRNGGSPYRQRMRYPRPPTRRRGFRSNRVPCQHRRRSRYTTRSASGWLRNGRTSNVDGNSSPVRLINRLFIRSALRSRCSGLRTVRTSLSTASCDQSNAYRADHGRQSCALMEKGLAAGREGDLANHSRRRGRHARHNQMHRDTNDLAQDR